MLILKSVCIRKLGYGFLFAFHSNNDFILYRFRDKARYWWKIAIFIPPRIRRLRYGGLRRNIAIPFDSDKLEWCVYTRRKKKTLGTCVTVSTEYQRVTDGQTDTHLATASRGKIMQTLSSEKNTTGFLA